MKAKKNPNEDIAKLVTEVKINKKQVVFPIFLKTGITVLAAIFIPVIMFAKPKLLYFRYGDGYAVIKYTKGAIQQSDTVVIPDTHNGKNVVAIANSAFENTKIKGYLDYVIDNIKNKNVGICFDSGHYHVHFNDELDFPKFKDRIFAVHLHDNDKSDDLHLIPFDGTLNWPNVVKNLKECNYSGPITLELCYRYEYLKMGINEFYKKGYEVGNKLKEMFEMDEVIL